MNVPDRGRERGEFALHGERSASWLAEDEEPEIDTRRIALLALAALTLLALLAVGAWWLVRDDSGPFVADGSTIHAPETPYKVRPDNPGGKVHDGTGDLSFAVGEGQTRQIKLAESNVPLAGATDEPGVGVQVGAYSSSADARTAWRDLRGKLGDVLEGVDYRIVEGRADVGTVYRLQAVAPNVDQARLLCSRLRTSGVACQVKQ